MSLKRSHTLPVALFPSCAVIRLQVGDLHAVGWGGPRALVSPIKAISLKRSGYFCKIICHQELSRIAQSGHTALQRYAGNHLVVRERYHNGIPFDLPTYKNL